MRKTGMRRPGNSHLSNAVLGEILDARRRGRPELCATQVYVWLDKLLWPLRLRPETREDLRSECLVYFLETIFPTIDATKHVNELRRFLVRSVYGKMSNIQRGRKTGQEAERMYRRRWRAPEPDEVGARLVVEDTLKGILTAKNPKEILMRASLASGMTGSDIAKSCGVSRERISKMNRG